MLSVIYAECRGAQNEACPAGSESNEALKALAQNQARPAQAKAKARPTSNGHEKIFSTGMGKLQLTDCNLGLVFISRSGCVCHAFMLLLSKTNLVKTQPKQLLVTLLLDILPLVSMIML